MKWKNHYLDNHIHFVTGSVCGYLPIFEYEKLIKEFICLINRMRSDFDMKFIAYVIMPEHYHFLIYHPQNEKIKSFLRTLLSKSSSRLLEILKNCEESEEFNWQFARTNLPKSVKRNYILSTFRNRANGGVNYSLWKEQCRVLPVGKEEKLFLKVNYIHNNPVRRQIVENPGAYKWSSCRFWEYREIPDIKIDRSFTEEFTI